MEYPALERFERLADKLDDLHARMQEQLDALRAEPCQVVDDSGLISVAVDHGGRVEQVTLDPRAMRMSSEELAERLTATARRAQEEAAARLRNVLHEVTGEDLPTDVLGG